MFSSKELKYFLKNVQLICKISVIIACRLVTMLYKYSFVALETRVMQEYDALFL